MEDQRRSSAPAANKPYQQRKPYQGRPNQGGNGQNRYNNNGGNRRPSAGGRPNGKPAQGGRRPFKKPFKKLSPQDLKVIEQRILRRERLEATYKVLNATFPLAFNRDDVKPLKRDIHVELFEHFDSENQPSDSPVKKSSLRAFLTNYIRCDAYHRAVIHYRKRFNLDGTPDTEFSPEEIEYHQENLSSKAANNHRGGNRNTQRPRNSSVKLGFNRGGAGAGRPHRSSGSFSRPGSTDRRPAATSGGFRPRQPFFKEGDIVYAGERKGTVKAIVKDKVSVLLENKLTLLLPFNQVRKAK